MPGSLGTLINLAMTFVPGTRPPSSAYFSRTALPRTIDEEGLLILKKLDGTGVEESAETWVGRGKGTCCRALVGREAMVG